MITAFAGMENWSVGVMEKKFIKISVNRNNKHSLIDAEVFAEFKFFKNGFAVTRLYFVGVYFQKLILLLLMLQPVTSCLLLRLKILPPQLKEVRIYLS